MGKYIKNIKIVILRTFPIHWVPAHCHRTGTGTGTGTRTTTETKPKEFEAKQK